MNTLYSDGKEALLAELARLAFPSYNGRKFQVQYGVKHVNLTSCWDGGSRTEHAIVHVPSMEVRHTPSAHPVFENQSFCRDFEIPAECVVVQHVIFCGKDMGINILTPQAAPLLPDSAAATLTAEERMVLLATRGLKSSYAGVSDYRAAELKRRGLTMQQITAARDALKARGLLNRAGAITTAGQNLLEQSPGDKFWN